jgi:hypothetical protein
MSVEGRSDRDFQNVPLGELVKLAAVDNDLFARTFFASTVRQRSPLFHFEMDARLDDPKRRKVQMQCFRGSAKTTKLRLFTAKRIAYGISKTVLYIGASESKASQSIMWLRSKIEPQMNAAGVKQRPLFSQAFDLSFEKSTETELKVKHGVTGETCWILGVGITGDSIRGINFDDYRPDLIILDDVVTDENAAGAEQREKISDLVLGAVLNSLAPVSEAPNAKIVMLQTPLHSDDVSARAARSPDWNTATFGCWTRATENFPTEHQESIWPERYPTRELRKQKAEAIAINKLSVFLREMECKLTSPEICPFKPEWLKYREGAVPTRGIAVLAIDPVPPPSDIALKKALKGKDYEAQTVTNKGHEPSWSVTTALSLAYKHRVARIVLQNINYERTLKWLLEKEMQRRGVYYMLVDTSSKSIVKSKYNRIVSAIQPVASQGHIFVDKSQADFIDQFVNFKLGIDHDDILDASANALLELINPHLELGEDEYAETWEDDVPKLLSVRGCP